MTQPPNPPYDPSGQPPGYGAPPPAGGYGGPPGGYGAPAPGGYGFGPPPSGPFFINVLGHEQGPIELGQLGQMALANQIKPDTPVRPADSQQYFAAKDVPGLFSDKEWLTAVLLAWFLGLFAVDRFYLGYTNLAIAKLCVSIFTCFIGGLIWQVIDLIMILMRNVPDAQGRPLR